MPPKSCVSRDNATAGNKPELPEIRIGQRVTVAAIFAGFDCVLLDHPNGEDEERLFTREKNQLSCTFII